MIRPALFLSDGPSDEPLGQHLERLCAERGVVVQMTSPDFGRLPRPPGQRVANRLQAAIGLGVEPEILFVHRDAEGRKPEDRWTEVRKAVAKVIPGLPHVAVVPVRMTEAWLLVDHGLIRKVAGRPNSADKLGVPPAKYLERQRDPKELLRDALRTASGLSGHQLKRFDERFGEHRRMILQQLDIHGPVRQLPAWQALESSINATLAAL